MKLYEILIPAFDNNGVQFPKDHHQKWDEWVIGLTGGLTILHANYKGRYEAQTEPIIPVRVACLLGELEAILAFTMRHYAQKSVMAYEISNNVIIRSK